MEATFTKLVEKLWEGRGPPSPFNGAQDIIVIQQEDGTLRSSGWFVHYSARFSGRPRAAGDCDVVFVKIAINNVEIRDFAITLDKFQRDNRGVPSFSPSPDDLKRLISPHLRAGGNDIKFYLENLPRLAVHARIFRWKWDSKIVITDVDGTLTRSDKRGLLYSYIGEDWMHPGVAPWFSSIKIDGYKVVFLTARPISISKSTRTYIKDYQDKDNAKLPDGPVLSICHGRVHTIASYAVTPHDAFKTSCLEQIRKLFPDNQVPLHAAFGNRETDRRSYRNAGIPDLRIYHVSKIGKITTYEDGKEIVTFSSWEKFFQCVSVFRPLEANSQKVHQQVDPDSD